MYLSIYGFGMNYYIHCFLNYPILFFCPVVFNLQQVADA